MLCFRIKVIVSTPKYTPCPIDLPDLRLLRRSARDPTLKLEAASKNVA